MGFKKIDPYFTFADLVLKDSIDKNRCLTLLKDTAASLDWDRIESILMNLYQVGGINEGVAIDARLVKSASRPVSNKKLKALSEKQDTPEGKMDKKGKAKKF